jgi:hypothetical protein
VEGSDQVTEIWKFPIDENGRFSAPIGAHVLSVQIQAGEVMVWALVHGDNRRVEVRLNVYGTGQIVSSSPGRFVSTVQMDDGLVWHFFQPE